MGYLDDPRLSRSGTLAFQADMAVERGDQEEARRLYAASAALEEEVALLVGPEAPRVKRVLLISASALWGLAGDSDRRQALLLLLDEPDRMAAQANNAHNTLKETP